MPLIQEAYIGDSWKVAVCCILLEKSEEDSVKRVIDTLFIDYPDAETMASGYEFEIERIVRPLGYGYKRAYALRRFSRMFVQERRVNPVGTERRWLSHCYGIGEYALDANRIFVEGDYSPPRSKDPALTEYAERKRNVEA